MDSPAVRPPVPVRIIARAAGAPAWSPVAAAPQRSATSSASPSVPVPSRSRPQPAGPLLLTALLGGALEAADRGRLTAPARHTRGLLFGRRVETAHYGMMHAPLEQSVPPSLPRRSYASAAAGVPPPPPPHPATAAASWVDAAPWVPPLPGAPPAAAPEAEAGVSPPPAPHPTSGFRAVLGLVRSAAVANDPRAIAELTRLLQPSDLALLRLLALKGDRRLRAARAEAGLEGAPPAAPAVVELGGGWGVARLSKPRAEGRGKEKESRLLGLDSVVEGGFKAVIAAEKEKERAARHPGQAGAAPHPATPVEEDDGFTRLRPLLAKLAREKVVRAWVMGTLRARLKDVKAAAGAATRVHEELLRGGGRRGASAAVAAAAAAAARPAHAFGPLPPPIPSDVATPPARPPASSRPRLTRLKKALLRERLERWLDANPDARAAYAAERAVHDAGAAAEVAAGGAARAALLAQADASIRAREAKRLGRQLRKGKIATPSVQVRNAAGRLVTTPHGDLAVYARLLASRLVIRKQRLRAEMRRLVEDGEGVEPTEAGAAAREAAEAEAVGAEGAALPSPSVDPSVTTARALARLDITYTTRKADIVAAVPKVSAGQARAGRERAAGGGAGAPAPDPGPPPTRSYVDQAPSPDLDELAREMVSTALFFQEKARRQAEEEGKGPKGGLKSKRRIVSGLREVAKGCRTGKVALVIVAPNIEESAAEGGLDDSVSQVLEAARGAEPPVPVIFALNRRKLGRAMGSTLRTSVVGLLSVENLRGLHLRAIEMAGALREAWAGGAGGGGPAPPTSEGPPRPVPVFAAPRLPPPLPPPTPAEIDFKALVRARLAAARDGAPK